LAKPNQSIYYLALGTQFAGTFGWESEYLSLSIVENAAQEGVVFL
jgi:hypothetical protein